MNNLLSTWAIMNILCKSHCSLVHAIFLDYPYTCMSNILQLMHGANFIGPYQYVHVPYLAYFLIHDVMLFLYPCNILSLVFLHLYIPSCVNDRESYDFFFKR